MRHSSVGPRGALATGLAAVAALCLAAAGLAPAAGVDLKVLSLNILEDTGTPSAGNANAWIYTAGPDRRDRAVRVIADEAPDIAGVQEIEPNQVADLTGTNALAAYAWFGAGRDDGQSAGQHELILYRAARFTRQASGVFWLSPTPDTPGSQYPGAAKVRQAVWARLLDRQSGRSLLVLNTHWDYQSAAARQYSAQLTRTRLAALATNSYVILTGDFNMNPTDAAYALLRGTADPDSPQIRDPYRQVYPVEQANELTSHNFTGNTSGKRIDFVFCTDEFTASAAAIVHTAYDSGRYPSDHYPVTTTLRVAPVRPAILAAAAGPAGITLTWSSVSGLPYRVRSSDGLLAWHDAFPATGDWIATGREGRCTFPVTSGAFRAYYRVVCWPQD